MTSLPSLKRKSTTYTNIIIKKENHSNQNSHIVILVSLVCINKRRLKTINMEYFQRKVVGHRILEKAIQRFVWKVIQRFVWKAIQRFVWKVIQRFVWKTKRKRYLKIDNTSKRFMRSKIKMKD